MFDAPLIQSSNHDARWLGRGVCLRAHFALVRIAIPVLIDSQIWFLTKQDFALPARQDCELFVHAYNLTRSTADDKGCTDFGEVLLKCEEMAL